MHQQLPVTRHESGYYPFREDITDLVKFGGTNTIAVGVDATKFGRSGWLYEGAGIYRHVWLPTKTAPMAIAADGIFVQPEFENNVPSDKAVRKITVEVSSAQYHDERGGRRPVNCEIISPEGKSLQNISPESQN